MHRSTLKDTSRVDNSVRIDADGDSVVSFGSGAPAHRKLTKFAWGATEKASEPYTRPAE